MEISVIAISNSKAIKLPKKIVKKYNIKDTVELVLEKDFMILKSKSTPRKGWGKSFKRMHKNEEDKLLLDDVFVNENSEK
jgi:antitoxin MazE